MPVIFCASFSKTPERDIEVCRLVLKPAAGLKESPDENHEESGDQQPVGHLAVHSRALAHPHPDQDVDVPPRGEKKGQTAQLERKGPLQQVELDKGENSDEERQDDENGPGPPVDGGFEIVHGESYLRPNTLLKRIRKGS